MKAVAAMLVIAAAVLAGGAPAAHAKETAHHHGMTGMSGMAGMSGMHGMHGMHSMAGMNMSMGRARAAAPATIVVTVKQWGMTASLHAVSARTLTLAFRNSSAITHRVAILRTKTPQGALPVHAGSPTLAGKVAQVVLAPHATLRLRLAVKAGRYVVVCALPGHYGHGNVTSIVVRAPASAGAAPAEGTTLDLKTVDVVKFDKTRLRAPAGRVTIRFSNTVPLDHNIALKGPGVDAKGPIVQKGSISTVSAVLKAGTYTFYCSLPGHAAAGMKGTLAVVAAGKRPPGSAPAPDPAPDPAPGPAGGAGGTGAGGGAAPAGAIQLSTSGLVGFDRSTLTAAAGQVTLSLVNNSALEHNIAISGNGVSAQGPVVGQGGVSSVTVDLAAGTYTFYCAISGHAAAGMTGTLIVTGASPSAPADPLAPPTQLTAGSIGATSLLLSWMPSPDTRVVRYEIARGATVLGTATSAGFAATGLTCATDYAFSVKAVDGTGHASAPATLAATTAACAPQPPPPSGGTVLDLHTNGMIGFNVTSLSAPAGPITIRLTNDSPFEHNIALTGNGFSLSGPLVQQGGVSSITATLPAGTYTFLCQVSGHVAAGMQGTLTVTGTAPPTPTPVPPAPPTNVVASGIAATTLHLGWTASPGTGIVGYDVRQGTTVLGRTPATGFDVSGLHCATPYTFGVESVDANGLASSAALVLATTAACPSPPPPPPSGGTVLDLRTNGGIGFNASTLSAPEGSITLRLTNDSSFDHNIALSGNGVNLSGPVVRQGGVSSVTTTLAPGTYTYYCEVGGHRQSGMVGTLTVTAATPPPPIDTSLASPTGLAASSVSATGLTLSWTASADSRVVSYRLARGTTALGTTAATSYPVTGLICATAYAFTVQGLDAAGTASSPATVSATTAPCDGATLNLSVTHTHTYSTTVLTAPRGRVTIVLHNQSTLPHAVRISNHGVDVSSPTAQPGETVSVTHTFTEADDYEFSCPLDGHSDERGTLYIT